MSLWGVARVPTLATLHATLARKVALTHSNESPT
jgi:hypothetical protein